MAISTKKKTVSRNKSKTISKSKSKSRGRKNFNKNRKYGSRTMKKMRGGMKFGMEAPPPPRPAKVGAPPPLPPKIGAFPVYASAYDGKAALPPPPLFQKQTPGTRIGNSNIYNTPSPRIPSRGNSPFNHSTGAKLRNYN